jgi:hypothetical protein
LEFPLDETEGLRILDMVLLYRLLLVMGHTKNYLKTLTVESLNPNAPACRASYSKILLVLNLKSPELITTKSSQP